MDGEPMALSAASPVNGLASPAARESAAAHATLEHQLVRAQAGETAAFCELLRSHQNSIYSLALRLLGVREDAEELAQDVFVALHRHLAAISSPAHLRFWLRRAVCHRAIDRLRRRPARPDLPLEAAGDLSAADADGDPLLRRALLRLMAQMAPVPRAVLLLRYQEDLDPGEIAEVLDVPVNTVKSHLKRSLAKLRERWKAELPDPGERS